MSEHQNSDDGSENTCIATEPFVHKLSTLVAAARSFAQTTLMTFHCLVTKCLRLKGRKRPTFLCYAEFF